MGRKRLLFSLVVLILIVWVAWFSLHNPHKKTTKETIIPERETQKTWGKDLLREVEVLREDVKRLERDLLDKERRIRELEDENRALLEQLVAVEGEKQASRKIENQRKTEKTTETAIHTDITPKTTSLGHISVGEHMLPPNNLIEILIDAKSRISNGFGGVELRKVKLLGNHVFVYVAVGAPPHTKPHLYKMRYEAHTKELLGMERIS
ncbi:MAG: hypothetical protein DRO11_03775 [Methanobacteriota archaeon]|nr:MAG: hypothetical protein DRO11_03775 [Euryarchaeota archaeon]